MALIPQPPELSGAPWDKVQHVLAFATLAGLGATAWRSMSLIKLLVRLSAFGLLIEVLQAIPALHRDFDLTDWLADTLAAAFVLIAVKWWRSARR